jgi:excisionase family DNA binding protein
MPNLSFNSQDLGPAARAQLAKTVGAGKATVRVGARKGAKAGFELPTPVAAQILALLHELVAGRSFQLVPVDEAMTTQQAADALGMSRQYLVRVLEEGALPYHKNGTHRRLRPADVKAFAARRDQKRRQRLDKLFGGLRKSGKYT